MIEQFRNAIVQSLKRTFPTNINIASFAGQITQTELARLGMASPALRVVVLGTDGTESKGGAPHATLAMAIFIITATGREGQPAEAAALKLAGTVLAHTVGNRWGMDAAAPTNVRAENCHSGELNANNTALWAVTFKQSVDISSCLILDELDDFLRCYVREKSQGTTTVEIHLPASGAEPALEGA